MADTKAMSPGPGVGRGPHVPAPLGRLIAQVAQGDQAAFSVVYDLIAPRVFGMCRRVLANDAEAEELTQQVMVEIWRTATHYDPGKGSVGCWALTMAHRRAADRRRAQRASVRRGRLFAGTNAETVHELVTETALCPADVHRVRDCLATLTDLQREAITLAYYGAHCYPEVADVLDIEPSAANARIREGLPRLCDCLNAMGRT